VGKDDRLNVFAVSTKPCGYPDIIRDDLAPAQLFRAAEVLLGNYDVTHARQCLKKLRDKADSSEAQKYADLLEKTAMPRDFIPAQAITLLKQAESIEETRDFDRAGKLYRALVDKYPRFEWAIVKLASHYEFWCHDKKTAYELFEQALTINPYNVYVLSHCVNLAKNFQEHEKAYAYCLRIRAADPTYTNYEIDWELKNHDRARTSIELIHRAPPIVRTSSTTTLSSIPDTIITAPTAANAPSVTWWPGPQTSTKGRIPDAVRTQLNAAVVQAIERRHEREDKYYPQIVNEKGEVQISFGPNVDTHGSFENGLLAVVSDHRTQYWNEQGKQAFARSFEVGKDFSEGLAAAKDGQWGFIDAGGNFVIENKFQLVESFSEGLAAVAIGGSWGFVNKRGEIVIEPIYERVRSFSNGLALVQLRDKIGYLDKNGRLAIPATFDSGRSFSDGLAEVGFLDTIKQELRLCYIDSSGKICIDTSKIEVTAVPADKEPDIYKLDDGKTVFGFKQGVGMSAGENLPRDFHCGLAGIQLGKYYGYINKSGQVAIQPIHKAVFDFSENLATIRPSYGLITEVINTSGNIVISPQYQEVGQFHDGIAAVSRWDQSSSNALCGFINSKGEQILPLQYFEASSFVHGFARVRPTPMSLASAKPASDISLAVQGKVLPLTRSGNESPWARLTAGKIAAAWPATSVCELDKVARFQFKLDHSGTAYDITFVDGCASPRTMLATVHSVLSAVPFEVPQGNATVALELQADSDGKPMITVGLAADSAGPADDKILAGMPHSKTSSGGIMRVRMYEKLIFLCAQLAKYPQSIAVKKEIEGTFKAFSLNPASAHAWLCVARGNPASLAMRQNPDDKDEINCNAPVGAIFQAWQLTKSKDSLAELEEAYRYKLALDLLRIGGDKPLYRGLAAELIDQYSLAVKNYSEDSTTPFAKKLASRFSRRVQIGTLQTFAGGPVNTQDWRPALKWLPLDSEVLIAVIRPQQARPKDPHKLVASLCESMQLMLGAAKTDGSDIQFALHGGRSFQSPSEIGMGTQCGADIKIFATVPVETHRDSSDGNITAATEKLEGFDIQVEEWKSRYSHSCNFFTARPFPNVEISASDRNY